MSTKTYYYDDGSCAPRTVTMTLGGCQFQQRNQSGIFFDETYIEEITFTLNAVASANIVVYYRYYVVQNSDWVGNYEAWQYTTATILAGQLSVKNTLTCLSEAYLDMGSGGQGYESSEITEYELLDQPTIPAICLAVPCDLAITSVDVTSPAIRGGLGSIDVTVSGATGATVTYKINGITRTTSGNPTGYTYSGLTSGDYTLLVQDGDCISQTGATVLEGDFRTGNFNISQPQQLVAVHNPIIYNVNTTQNTIISQRAQVYFTVDDVRIEDGFRIVFNLNKPNIYNQTFFARTFPNRNNFFLASDITDRNNVVQGQNDRAEIVQSIAEVFGKDITISQNYEIAISGSSVFLTARQTGSKFDLNTTNVFIRNESNVDVLTGITMTVVQGGIDKFDGEIVDNYSIYGEVFLNKNINVQYPETGDDLDYIKVSELTIPFQLDNRHLFDIQNVVRNYVFTAKPFYEFTGYTVLPEMLRPVFVKFGESYPIVSNSNTVKKRFKSTTDKRWVINSALDYYVNNDMSAYITTPRKFFTNSPNPLQIQRQQNLYLYFLIERNLGYPISCEGDIYYFDGTENLDVKFFDIATGTTNAGGVFMLNLSYDKLGLEDYEFSGSTVRKIKYVDVKVVQDISGTTTGLTETKRFSFNINEQPRKFGIIFQNLLGAYDSVDFVGIVERSVNREYGEYTVVSTPNNFGAFVQGFKNSALYNTKITKTIVCNTGFLNKAHLNWLEELLASNNIYDYTEDNQHYLKVVDYKYIESSQEDIFDMEITFEYTIYQNGIKI
jgi:hypothetical protein